MTREEAIEKVRQMSLPKETMEILEALAPELAESEDERIRKEIIRIVDIWTNSSPVVNGIPRETFLAWLEKQKEVGIQWLKSDNVKNPDKPYIDKVGMFYTTDGRMCPASKIEKQKEQKPNVLQNAFDKSKKDYTLEEKSKASDYAESILPTSAMYGESEEEYKLHTIIEAAFIAGQKEQKPSIFPHGLGEVHWNPIPSAKKELMENAAEKLSKEEYVKKFKALCGLYEIKLPNREYDIYGLCEDLHKLFGDIQKPAEWSEEDEAHRNFILESLEDQIRFCKKDAEGAHYAKQIRTAQNWLKSLRPPLKDKEMKLKILKYLSTRCSSLEFEEVEDYLNNLRPSWKPSEEQMEALQIAAMESKTDFNTLTSLLADLMKL